MRNILTVDGPSGVGKGTVARAVAQKMGWHLLDSGAIYRAFALAANSRGINTENEQALAKLAQELDLDFINDADNDLVSVYLDGKDVSNKIREEKTGDMASRVASIGVVREALLKRQRAFAREPGLVADGRDMGTKVFINAKHKVYLTASAEERASRRLKQLQQLGSEGIMSRILADVVARDERDSSREHSPLVPAKDALIIDTTDLSIDEVVTKVMTLVEA
ncbi:MAG TPA: (d)CMP kinase [Gammaproteobacteria bacterium]|jgi:cytidylate kinase|nr:(d)CMP kinase [Gammaproteobacteria bacterium]HAY41196.1 (d)CMP kinase [Gammaproteobacteria bacterium]|tara:strand:- start:684 stop:1349 length:666 start_codon:yes stop_codon:yes gene_type:complete